MDQELINIFTALAEGKLSGEEWLKWFDTNKDLVEKDCGRTAFLKIKPKANLSTAGNAFAAQTAVFNWLKTQNINADLNDVYEKQYNAEFEAFCRAEKQKEKDKRNFVKDNFGYIEKEYPKFFKQLVKTFDTSNQIEKGKTEAVILDKETDLEISFSADLKTFWNTISKLELEGITIDFEHVFLETFNEKEYLVLGEFWLHGDGDLLLYNAENGQISSYAHEYRPPKIIKLADSMTVLLEKNITAYLKSYE